MWPTLKSEVDKFPHQATSPVISDRALPRGRTAHVWMKRWGFRQRSSSRWRICAQVCTCVYVCMFSCTCGMSGQRSSSSWWIYVRACKVCECVWGQVHSKHLGREAAAAAQNMRSCIYMRVCVPLCACACAWRQNRPYIHTYIHTHRTWECMCVHRHTSMNTQMHHAHTPSWAHSSMRVWYVRTFIRIYFRKRPTPSSAFIRSYVVRTHVVRTYIHTCIHIRVCTHYTCIYTHTLPYNHRDWASWGAHSWKRWRKQKSASKLRCKTWKRATAMRWKLLRYMSACVCMYVCMFACIFSMYVLYVSMYVCKYVCVHACDYSYMTTYVCMHSMYLCICICMYIYIYIYIYTCVCTYVCSYVCIWVDCMYVWMDLGHVRSWLQSTALEESSHSKFKHANTFTFCICVKGAVHVVRCACTHMTPCSCKVCSQGHTHTALHTWRTTRTLLYRFELTRHARRKSTWESVLRGLSVWTKTSRAILRSRCVKPRSTSRRWPCACVRACMYACVRVCLCFVSRAEELSMCSYVELLSVSRWCVHWLMRTWMCLAVYVCVHVKICACIYTYMFTHKHTWRWACACVCCIACPFMYRWMHGAAHPCK
jgi:hypothetical protein